MKKLSEFDVIQKFTNILGLKNQTDGTVYFYNNLNKGSKKPDGIYYYDGITFILDAKAEGKQFIGQLEDYMKFEKNPNYIGFKYNNTIFECYVNGKKIVDEKIPQNYIYYKEKYFYNIIKNNEDIINESAKKLANLFWHSKINKQYNVPFIGACMLVFKFGNINNIDLNSTTNNLLNSIKLELEKVIKDTPLTRKEKKNFLITALNEPTLRNASIGDLYLIFIEIEKIYNFISISITTSTNHDIMNNFLKIFRRWNSIDANEKGEVFTPDHIASLMFDITRCTINDIILDPTCGSGTFLVNAMVKMIELSPNKNIRQKIAEEQIFGIELNTFNSCLAGINMMLHGDGASHIYNADCFVKIQELKNKYTRVLMNPPFAQSISELSFVKLALDNLANDGILSTILPKSCVEGKDNKNKLILKEIFDFCQLESVISLPQDLFTPNANVSTCILTFHKTNCKHDFNKEVLLINMSDDGFIYSNQIRKDINNKWSIIKEKILKCFNHTIQDNEFLFIYKKLKYDDELLFEGYSSYREFNVSKEVFARYMRESVSSRILCNNLIEKNTIIFNKNINIINVKRFKINTILKKIQKGNAKSINRKLEDKYNLIGYPLIIAKKDNNGIGGMKIKEDKESLFENKFVIISGGDGGGGKTYYCPFKFLATNFVLICSLQDNLKLSKYVCFYISVKISEKLFTTINHGRTISDVPNIEIELPINSKNEIDIDYIENFVKSLPFAKYY